MINKSLLFEILEIQSHSRECWMMTNFLFDYLVTKGYHVDLDDMDNIYVTKGTADAYPCIVAHVDTVHKITKGGIKVAQYVGNTDIVFGMNPLTGKVTGIGGDDKCGIYAALHCLENLPHCKAAFFVDEEIGCVGSSKANMDFFTDCRYILQADRRGNDDFVKDICGAISSDAFLKDVEPIIKQFGYSFAHGMMTDVQALRDNDVGISVANMSAGYYSPHSDSEYININDLENVCNMMMEICEQMTLVYPFIYVPPVWKYDRRESLMWRGSTYTGGGGYSPMNHADAEWWETLEEEEAAYVKKFEEAKNTHYPSEMGDEEDEATYIKRIEEMTDAEFQEFEASHYAGKDGPSNPMS